MSDTAEQLWQETRDNLLNLRKRIQPDAFVGLLKPVEQGFELGKTEPGDPNSPYLNLTVNHGGSVIIEPSGNTATPRSEKTFQIAGASFCGFLRGVAGGLKIATKETERGDGIIFNTVEDYRETLAKALEVSRDITAAKLKDTIKKR